MRIESTSLDDVLLIEVEPNVDDRGSFSRTFCENEFAAAGLPTRFPQCNLSTNRHSGTLRGMHYNAAPYEEPKLVRCVRGAIYDVIVDLRAGSATRLQWLGFELTADNARALYVPPGFAHGFLTLEDGSDVYYHMGDFYRPEAARGFRWDDPAVGITWPVDPSIMSRADGAYPALDLGAVGS